MLRSNVTKSFAVVAVGFFAAHAGIAQEVKNLPPGATAHLSIFPLAAISWIPKTKPKYTTWLD